MKIDLVEGKQRQHKKKYHKEYGEGTAVSLRLVEDWFGTGRTIVGDSYFSSVKTLNALRERGLYYMGIVKTATTGFPVDVFKSWSDGSLSGTVPNRGDHFVLESEDDHGNKLYALAWKDKKDKRIVSNRGTTNPGSDKIKKRHKKVVSDGKWQTSIKEVHIKRPHMVELLYSAFSTVDVHDHYRQGSLAIELEWYTHHWTHRLLGTIFGMCVVDSFLAYKFELGEALTGDMETVDFNTFIHKLAYQMIFNIFLEGPVQLRYSSFGNESLQVTMTFFVLCQV